jgi:hypothetical protein
MSQWLTNRFNNKTTYELTDWTTNNLKNIRAMYLGKVREVNARKGGPIFSLSVRLFHFRNYQTYFDNIWLLKPKCGFEILTALVMKSTVFWDKMPCSPLKVNRRFGWTYRLHLQEKTNQEIIMKQVARWFLAWLITGPWRWRQHVPPKHRSTFNELHGVISQKTKVFIYW